MKFTIVYNVLFGFYSLSLHLKKNSKSMFGQFLKTILQLILAPRKAWSDVAEDDPNPARVLERGLYPLMAIMALTAFCHGFYGAEPFQIGRALESALGQFLSLFLTVMIARGAFESLMPPMQTEKVPMARIANVSSFSTGILAIINIIANLCPIDLAIFWFLPAFLIVVLWHAAEYLSIREDRYAQFIILAISVLIILPILFNFILSLVL